MDGMRILSSGAGTIAASIAMGIVCYYTVNELQALLGVASKLSQLVAVGGSILVGILVYFFVASLLRMEEVQFTLEMLGRRFHIRRQAAGFSGEQGLIEQRMPHAERSKGCFMMDRELIRNFCIIAHIDHGKSTLADRFLEVTGTVDPRQMIDQVLDQMDLERERGITIKLQPVRMRYRARDGREYVLNLIDTPGHVDFSYEVSRSLAACEGAILVVDATQGVEAQTIANAYLAVEAGLEIIPVINKIDIPAAEPDRVAREIEDVFGIKAESALRVSAKEGWGVPELLEAVIAQVPPPGGDSSEPLQALIFDSHFDSYKGAISYIRVFQGSVRRGLEIRMMSTGKDFDVGEVGVFTPAHAAGGGAWSRRGWLPGRRLEERRGHQGGGHHHRRRQACCGAAARIPAGDAGGLLWHVPGGAGRLR